MPNRDQIFVIGSLLTCLSSLIFIQQVSVIANERNIEAEKRGIFYPKWSDFYISFIALIVLCFLRVFLSKTLFYWIGEKLIKSKDNREERVSRFGTVIFKLFYFIFSSSLGYYALKDKDWLPPIMGGTGNMINLWKNGPYQEVDPLVQSYFLVNVAYHFHSLVFHINMPKRNDFVEMLTHHFLAIFLMVFSYMMNYIRIGSLVLLVHDIPDIPGYAVKAATLLPYPYFTMSVYSVLLIVWGFERLYVYPVYIISACFGQETAELGDQDQGRYFFFFLLSGLFLMHVYWYALFLYMGYRYATTGSTEDIQQKIGDHKKKN